MPDSSPSRVVVTGLGVVSDIGSTTERFWTGLKEGRSGAGPITAFEQDDRWTVRIAGEASDWDPNTYIQNRDLRRMDRFTAMGLHAACEAAADAGFDPEAGDPYRHGVAVGSGVGGILTIEEGLLKLLEAGPSKMSPFTVPKLMVNACAGNISIRFNLRGFNTATATACATAGHAIGHAFRAIRAGRADQMFAGGAEAAVSPLCISCFAAMKALSTRNDEPHLASRPFDKRRDGFVLAEGAAILVLESLPHALERNATIYAEVGGFGCSGDAQHIAAPDEDGAGARHAMLEAVEDANLPREAIGYINAHGTSTPLGDAAEVAAVKTLFGEHARSLAISSTKSMTGHALGASGGLESVATVLALHHGILPPTINLDEPDDDFDLDFVPHTAREQPIDAALNNTFGFGGHNVSLCFKRYVP